MAGLAAFMKAVDPTLSNGVIVGRIARNADPAATQAETGNGRIFMPRALADTSTEFVQPAVGFEPEQPRAIREMAARPERLSVIDADLDAAREAVLKVA